MKTKICGVCRAEDARAVAEAGADFVGVILAPKGPRQQTIDSAMPIYAAAGDTIRVGVFADQTIAEIARVAGALELDVLQLHGAETSSYIHELESEVDAVIWKTVSLTADGDLQRVIDAYGDDVDGLLLDAATGGSGQRFEWSLAARARELLPAHVGLIVAGGLTPDNVRDVVAYLKPDVVDVASGVEEAIGRKDAKRIRSFVRNAKS